MPTYGTEISYKCGIKKDDESVKNINKLEEKNLGEIFSLLFIDEVMRMETISAVFQVRIIERMIINYKRQTLFQNAYSYDLYG